MCLAVPGKVVSLGADDPLIRPARVSFGGIVKEVSLAYVPEAQVGDWVLVHVGFALARIDEAAAQKVFDYLEQLGEVEELREGGAP